MKQINKEIKKGQKAKFEKLWRNTGVQRENSGRSSNPLRLRLLLLLWAKPCRFAWEASRCLDLNIVIVFFPYNLGIDGLRDCHLYDFFLQNGISRKISQSRVMLQVILIYFLYHFNNDMALKITIELLIDHYWILSKWWFKKSHFIF